jgi:4-hydroxythreonine-4-phosphate dehydrogenase
MMLVAGSLRVSHVTTHLALRQACERVRQERVLQVIRLTHQAVVRMGVRRPHIAVAGLNPHAGEGGLFGREEIDEISPAIRSAQAEGIDAAGPYPPDTVFYLATQAAGPGRPPMDAVVAMVHDHGHIAVKLMGFMEGVNLTLGLPIIRTSPDHGTAFDKAGKGTADPSSMVQAILLAARMAKGQRER